MSENSRFKSPEAEARYREAYEATMALWGVEYDALDVDTRFGITRVNAAGSPDSPPLILLHGGALCSTSWFANAGALSQHFRVYAPDLVDYTGLSQPVRPIKNRQDCTDWLNDMLDALNIERASIAGHSYGAWMALNHAMKTPERIEKMILIAPAPAFGRFRIEFFLRFIPVFFSPTRQNFYRVFQNLSTALSGDYHPLIEQFYVSMQTFKPEATTLSVMSFYKDEEFRQITTPTLLLIGENEVVCNPQRAITHAQKVMPHIETELVADAGHVLIADQPEIVNARILKFLKQAELA